MNTQPVQSIIKERLISLDVFRGLTILFMIIVNNPGNWSAIYQPLEHAVWNGCTPADLVFPFFIFIMGAALPFAMPVKGLDGAVFVKILTRSMRIFCLGLFLNTFSKIDLFGIEGIALILGRLAITAVVCYALLGSFAPKVKLGLALMILLLLLFLCYSGIEAYKDVRIPGVLQRIGVVYFFIALLYTKTNQKIHIATGVLLLLIYWGLMALVAVPGIGAANFDVNTNLAAWFDRLFLTGHMWVYTLTWDPEGILSTVPAIATGIIGVMAGQWLLQPLFKPEMIKRLAIAGAIMIPLGLAWGMVFPINKSLWTSSYVLYTSGLALLCLSFLYYIIELQNYKKWAKLFLVWGVNPMIVFFFSGIIPKVLRMIELVNPEKPDKQINIQEYFYKYNIVPLFDNAKTASAAFAVLNVIFWSFVLWILYRRKLIFKV